MQEILSNDAHAFITPGRIMHKMGFKMECARCAPLVNAKIVKGSVPGAQARGRPVQERENAG